MNYLAEKKRQQQQLLASFFLSLGKSLTSTSMYQFTEASSSALIFPIFLGQQQSFLQNCIL